MPHEVAHEVHETCVRRKAHVICNGEIAICSVLEYSFDAYPSVFILRGEEPIYTHART